MARSNHINPTNKTQQAQSWRTFFEEFTQMASIADDGGGFRRILFKVNGKREKIHLGKTSAKGATEVKGHIEEIIEAKTLGRRVEDLTAKWLRDIDDDFHKKLVSKGLAQPRAAAIVVTLGQFIEEFVTKRQAKPSSKEVWRAGKMALVEFFGADKPIAEITLGMADDFVEFLKAKKVKNKAAKTLSPMTIRNRLNFAKMIFRAAGRHKLIAADPFADVKVAAPMSDRQRFISREDTAKLLEAAPGQDWKAIIALARYGGLRCASEVLSLTWNDIDWEHGRIRVTSPKTEHHPGGGSRIMPLFPELREVLQEVYEAAPDGAVYVCGERHRREALGPNGWRNTFLRAAFERIIKQAGLTPWPRPFHNLRSSRQTELSEQFPSHVVCAWIGNTEKIAAKHYLQTTDEHFAKATAQTTAQTIANYSRPVQTFGNAKHEKFDTVATSHEWSTENCEVSHIAHAPDFSGKMPDSPDDGAQKGAFQTIDNDLSFLVERWPVLSAAVKSRILALASGDEILE